ncbi:hypothetical protein PV392_08225 [Streptomyces sp. ME03-5709C]|nr:hypothetical protein [Streptomyces sp. ME03-5709C]
MNKLTKGQAAVLILAALPMAAVGVAGAIGTYANATSVLHRSQTALGVVAAGEGATLVAALVMIGVTMLGQSAPSVVRAALWLLPTAAAVMGITIAPTVREAVVYGLTPLAMTASAEGISFLARRIVVHRTGVDAEAQRRNAETVQRLAYHRARAVNHPSEWARKRSARAAWRLAKRVGVGDAELGAQLVEVQRTRLRDGADAALLDMYGTATPALEATVTETVTVAEPSTTLAEHFAEAAEVVTPQVPVETVVERVEVPPVTLPEVTATPPVQPRPAIPAPPAKHLIICGDRKVWHLEPPAIEDEEEVTGSAADRLPTEQAANVIRAAWVLGTSVAETARMATRSTSYVKKVFARLDETRNSEPAKPITLVRTEATA